MTTPTPETAWARVRAARDAVHAWFNIHKPLTMSQDECTSQIDSRLGEFSNAWNDGVQADLKRLGAVEAEARSHGFDNIEGLVAAFKLARTAPPGVGMDAAVEAPSVPAAAPSESAPPTVTEAPPVPPTEGYEPEQPPSAVAANENPNSVIGGTEAK